MSDFRIAIVRADGKRVLLYPGSRGERDLIETVTAAVVEKGVGIFRTETKVKAAIAEGIAEVLQVLKSEVVPPK
jgi:phenylpyruvate tautomerase PptA (4-oxalocrotonate tautomerase family)